MSSIKRFFKRNSHNTFFRLLGGLGFSIYRFYENRNHDIQSNGELTVIKKISKMNPSVIFDGGANIGNYSLCVNKLIPNSKIYAFEPVNDTFNKLKNNTKNFENITALNIGLYSENCAKEINLFSSDTHSSIFKIEGINYKPVNKANIELIKGDDFLKNNNIKNIDFLKLDLEGAEFDALLGFKESLKNGIIKIIQFEFGYINISTRKLLIDYYDLFEKYGYIIGKIYPKSVDFRNYNKKHEDFIGPNYIAVKKNDFEIIKILS
jgi:FkbM family methyltransferase